MTLNSCQVTLLAGLSELSTTTVARVYAGRRCEVSTWVRLERAAAQLGLPPPPKATSLVGDGSSSLRIEAKR